MLISKVLYSGFILITVNCVTGNGSLEENGPDTSDEQEILFKKLFKLRRAEQLAAIKGLRTLGGEDKQKKMISTITEKVFAVILKSRVVLESSGYIPGVSKFPTDETTRDALANILENTAFMGDILLRMPDISQPILRSSGEWPVLYAWSLAFANQTQLLDNSTNKLIDLVSQELNLTLRHPDYINPYRKENEVKRKEEQLKENVVPKKKKKKLDIPRGPRLSARQAGDL